MSTGLRDRKKIETRRAIAGAALRLTLEHGPDGVTIEQISEAADVSPRTFFNYFSSKEEAILGIDPERRADMRNSPAARPPDEAPLEALRATLLAHAITYADDAEQWAQQARLAREHTALFRTHVASFAEFERELVEIIADRSGADPDLDLYPSLVVTTTLTAMRVVLNHWQVTQPDRPLSELLEVAFRSLESGLDPAVTRRAAARSSR
jgi:AcrR family transcriptional regulator